MRRGASSEPAGVRRRRGCRRRASKPVLAGGSGRSHRNAAAMQPGLVLPEPTSFSTGWKPSARRQRAMASERRDAPDPPPSSARTRTAASSLSRPRSPRTTHRCGAGATRWEGAATLIPPSSVRSTLRKRDHARTCHLSRQAASGALAAPRHLDCGGRRAAAESCYPVATRGAGAGRRRPEPLTRSPRKFRPYEWSGKRDSDPRPSAWEADALPTELFPRHRADLPEPGSLVKEAGGVPSSSPAAHRWAR
jgi:hypothetical protein